MTETPQGHELFHQKHERIQREMVECCIPSLAIAVAKGNSVLWEEGFGWADRERRIAATPHTLYSLASISKPITAPALTILKERGLLNLDTPLTTTLGSANCAHGHKMRSATHTISIWTANNVKMCSLGQ